MNLLVLGPCSGPMTGQRRMFELAIDKMTCEKLVISTGEDKSLHSVFNNLLKIFRYKNRVTHVYFTPSRSLLGMYRDFAYLYFTFKSNPRIVGHIHGSDWLNFYNSLNFFNMRVYNFLYRRVSLFIVLVGDMEHDLRNANYFGDIAVVPNCVDYD